MDRSISPLSIISSSSLSSAQVAYSFGPKAPTPVHYIEEVFVLLTPEPVQPGDLEIAPEVTHIVLFPFHVFGVDVFHSAVSRLGLQNLFG